MENSTWLEKLQRHLAEITEPAAAKFWPNPKSGRAFFNYRLEHVRQVHRDAETINKQVGGGFGYNFCRGMAA